MQQKIIALLGMPGSGKTEAIQYLQEKYQWPKVYFGKITLEEVQRLGLPLNQDNERKVREGLRKQFGEDHYAKQIIKKIGKLSDSPFVLVDGLYSWTEYLVFKKYYGDLLTCIAIYASPHTRYNRLAHRPTRPLTRREATLRDKTELENLSKGSPLALADFMIVNESSVEEMCRQLEKVVEKLKQ